MQLVGDSALKSTPGNIGAVIRGGVLAIPCDVHRLAAAGDSYAGSYADAFISYVQTFPTYFAEGLHWTVPQFQAAVANLISSLRGKLDDKELDFPRRKFAYGALPPWLAAFPQCQPNPLGTTSYQTALHAKDTLWQVMQQYGQESLITSVGVGTQGGDFVVIVYGRLGAGLLPSCVEGVRIIVQNAAPAQPY